MRRVDIFSDGVFAIAITLLVLELPFQKVGQGQLAHALGHRWTTFAAYLVSFFGIGIAWLHHHAAFEALARVTRPLVLLNLLLLATIAFLPFPTGLIGDYIEQGGGDARTAALTFSGAWTASVLAMTALWSYACRHPELIREGVRPAAARRFRTYLRIGSGAYVGFTLVALVSPIATLALYAAAGAFFLWRSDFQALEVEPEGGAAP